MTNSQISRRRFLAGGAVIAGAMGGGLQLVLPDSARAENAKVVIKLDWLMSNGQIGDAMAAQQGFFTDAGLDVEFNPGGPNSATVPPVVSGDATLGQFSESTQLVAARASGVPVKILACGFRTGPYALASLPKAPVRSAADMIGKKIGIQPTARVVIDAIIAKNNLDPSQITIVNVGFDKAPLERGEVDAIGGWVTNTQALSVLGPDRIDLLVSDMGLPSYANVYFATDAAIDSNAEVLAKFIGAVSKGWEWTKANPEEAVKKTVAAYPDMSLEWELKTIDLILKLSFNADTARDGWGTFDPAKIEEQIAMFDALKQYEQGRPKLEDVYTLKVLDLTKDVRPKI
ncbi:MAG: ABC transporter substrate-binding protein [Alphaproteobacteria bacterium]|nr:ABC transporter substrate-binding protein [Alphaproteobacteria bacterium]